MPGLNQFEKQQYLNMETFRKSGNGVKTPVWFAQEGEVLFIWTETHSGKAKRIRNNGKVRIVPSKGDGAPLGEWREAEARVVDSTTAMAHIQGLMERKYGFVFKFLALMGRIRRSSYTSIQISLV